MFKCLIKEKCNILSTNQFLYLKARDFINVTTKIHSSLGPLSFPSPASFFLPFNRLFSSLSPFLMTFSLFLLAFFLSLSLSSFLFPSPSLVRPSVLPSFLSFFLLPSFPLFLYTVLLFPFLSLNSLTPIFLHFPAYINKTGPI